MSYVLESNAEFERLERQSRNPAYDFRRELESLTVAPGAKILDAGCGSGIVTRYLGTLYPHARIDGCDLSAPRLEMARAAARDLPNLSFTACNLARTPFQDGSFELVISRYVFQHLGPALPRVLAELNRVLRPGGKLVLIDGDGLFVNLYPQSRAVRSALAKISRAGLVDFSVGRKLPSLMADCGLGEISWRVLTANHEGDARAAEMQLMRERFSAAEAQFIKVLGKKTARTFVDSYLRELESPVSTYCTQTFVVTGVKPAVRHPQLVK